MLCTKFAKFDWNWPSGYGEEDGNVKTVTITTIINYYGHDKNEGCIQIDTIVFAIVKISKLWRKYQDKEHF